MKNVQGIGDETMAQTQIFKDFGNGAGMPHETQSKEPVQPPANIPFAWLTRDRALTWCGAVIIGLISAGWFMLPAKERDLQDLQGDVQRLDGRIGQAVDRMEALTGKIERGLEKIGDKIDSIQEGQRANREEIIRLTVTAKAEETKPAPVPPQIIKVIEREPKQAVTAKAPAPAKPVAAAQQEEPGILKWLK